MIDSPRQPDSVGDPPGPLVFSHLLASLMVDQRRRWKCGERPLVEEYLAQNPVLVNNPEAILDLLYNEYVIRVETGEMPELDEYLRRFPDLADPFRLQIELHEGLASLQGQEQTHPQAANAPVLDPPPGYEVLGVLGRGGMGIVCKARDLELDRVVALKRIRAGEFADEHDRAQFLAEAKAAARLQHPNIVQIHEVGEADGQPYLVLEFVDGPSLREALAGKPCPPEQAARLVRALALAIHHAHERGVIHRDLKPANILLHNISRTDAKAPRREREEDLSPSSSLGAFASLRETLVPKITDFGLAKRLDVDQSQTKTGTLLGTPSYMAPEQASGKPHAINCRTDIYALGVILYEMLTGRPPFLAPTVLETLYQVRDQEPVGPRRLRPQLPRGIETICLKCLQKDPARRYATGEELADELQRFLDGRPILARPAGMAERAWRWCRRNPVVASLAGAILLLLLLITAGSLTAALLLNNALADTRAAKQEAIRNQVEAVVAQARAASRSDVPGRRFDALQGLARATDHGPSLRLRNLAIECLTLPDLRVVDEKPLAVAPLHGHGLFADMARDRYAVTDDRGTITLGGLRDGTTLSVAGPGYPAWMILFSPDGRYLAAKHHRPRENPNNRLRVWDLQPSPPVLLNRLPMLAVIGDGFAFTPDSRRLVVNWDDNGQGTLAMHDLTPPHPERVLARDVWYERLAIDREGGLLAATAEGGPVEIYDLDRAVVLHKWKPPAVVYGLAWRPDGHRLALACANRNAYLCESDGTIRGTCEGHEAAVTGVAFNRGGDLLATTGWDGSVRLWDGGSGKRHVTVTPPIGGALRFSPDDRFLGFGAGNGKVWRWEVATGRECRGLAAHLGADDGPENVGFSPTAPLLASSGSDGVWLWDTNTGALVGRLPLPDTKSVVWQGGSLVTCSKAGLQRWPVALAVEGKPGIGRIGPPEQLAAMGEGQQDRAGASPAGRWIAVTDAARGEIILLDAAGAMKRVPVSDRTANRWIAVSDDGHWLATSAWGASGALIWDVRTAKLVAKLPCGSVPRLAFSPDGRRLATGTGQKYDLWDMGTWTHKSSISLDETGELPRPIAFSSDGRLMAIAPTPRVVRLLDTATGSELATLKTVSTPLVNWLAFSPDNSRLAVAAIPHLVQLWDLRALRRGLAELKLEGDLPAWEERTTPVVVPRRFEVVTAPAR